MHQRSFAHREISWMIDQMLRDYPDSPSKIWRQRTGLEELPEIRIEEERYQARIQNASDFLGEFLKDFWTRGK